jgi:hypothetical protein
MDVRITDDIADVMTVVSTLVEHLEEMPRPEQLGLTLSRMLEDGTYRFFIARSDTDGSVVACGIVTFFTLPMADDHVLGVEALWLREDDRSVEDLVWTALINFARKLQFRGILVSEYSINRRPVLERLLRAGNVQGYPVHAERFWLQKVGNVDPVFTSFCESSVRGAVFSSVPVVAIGTRMYVIDVDGVEYQGSEPLYRGEGRLVRPNHWTCSDVFELAEIVSRNGIAPRTRELPPQSHEAFTGTIAEQLLHQGYVGQGAISLSMSFDIATRYAIHAGEHDVGLVFTIDPDRLRKRTRIFSASETLARACPWIPLSAWSGLTAIVQALQDDLVAAGRLLEACHKEAWKRAKVGAGSLQPAPDLMSHLSGTAQKALSAAGIGVPHLAEVYRVFEEFAEFAQDRVGSVDTIHVEHGDPDRVQTERVEPMAYFLVFDRIVDVLEEARPDWAVGWDNTVYGYIAKTFRDAELFTAGEIPGDAITACHVVKTTGAAPERLAR